jgi:hypothetical protein
MCVPWVRAGRQGILLWEALASATIWVVSGKLQTTRLLAIQAAIATATIAVHLAKSRADTGLGLL